MTNNIYFKKAFGEPDGARTQIVKDINIVGSTGFVNFPEQFSSDINLAESDLKTRIIVGKKGSGKTTYLRRIQIYCKNSERNFYVDDLNFHSIYTSEIIKFSEFYDGEVVSSKWMAIWRCAILRSLTTHIFNSKVLKKYLKSSFDISAFKKNFKSILSQQTTPSSVYTQVKEIINNIENRRSFEKFINSFLWYDLEVYLSEILKTLPTICFFIDAIDEEYHQSPQHWLLAQKGLFYEVMRLFRNNNLNNLYIFISIRDNVYFSILQGEHSSRYLQSNSVKILNWDEVSIKYLLEKKVSVLDKTFFVENSSKNTIYNWLGTEKIFNSFVNTEENVVDYILRHTRMIPRDIILMGNILCERIVQEKNVTSLRGVDRQSLIKEQVSKIAYFLGREQVHIAVNHFISQLMQKDAYNLNLHEDFLGISGYIFNEGLIVFFQEKIIEIIKLIGKDRFTYEEKESLREQANNILGIDRFDNLLDIFWQNNILGIENNQSDEVIFYNIKSFDFKLPKFSNYAFHPIILTFLSIINTNRIIKPILSTTY